MAECGCYSFHPRKIVAIGEGGMIVLNDEEMYEKLRILRDHGRNR
jgi:dTDP-4-amino-4,6-dideoxygalactose transaminase